jgi:hypothetical protein
MTLFNHNVTCVTLWWTRSRDIYATSHISEIEILGIFKLKNRDQTEYMGSGIKISILSGLVYVCEVQTFFVIVEVRKSKIKM